MSAFAWLGLMDAGDLLYVCGSLAVVLALMLVEVFLVGLRERSIRGYLGPAAGARGEGD